MSTYGLVEGVLGAVALLFIRPLLITLLVVSVFGTGFALWQHSLIPLFWALLVSVPTYVICFIGQLFMSRD